VQSTIAHRDLEEAIGQYISDRVKVSFWVYLLHDAEPIALTESFFEKPTWLPIPLDQRSDGTNVRDEVAAITISKLSSHHRDRPLGALARLSESTEITSV
jgi:hypothetical protein